MNKMEIVLASMAPARGANHTPVQVQKLLFLIDQQIKDLVGGPHFDFQPYNYGPFDKNVYKALEQLADQGLVDISDEENWKVYRLTVSGQEKGQAILETLHPSAQDYIVRASDFVRKLTFTQLVSAIYKAYPAMRANSVFQSQA